MNNSAFLSVVLMLAVLTGGCGKGPDKTGPSQEATPRAEEAIGDEKLNVTFDEFQRLVYSSHVLTVIDAKPELEGSLLALLELQRQNPEANSTSLVKPVRRALEEYRKEASSHTLPVTWRDEVLGRYFLKLCEALEPGEQRREVALNLLKVLLAQANPPDLLGQQAGSFHAGGQRLLAVASGPRERQALVESCTRRAQTDASFATAMNELLLPEIGIAHDAPPRDILAKNEALAQTPTMQALMQLNSSSEDGSVVITMDKLEDLFAAELTAMRDVVRTAQPLHREVRPTQEDLAKYPDSATRLAANIQRHAKELAGQRGRIAACSAAAMALSQMVLDDNPGLASKMSTVTAAVGLVATGVGVIAAPATGGASLALAVVGTASCLAGVAEFATLGIPTEESPDQIILDSIKLVGKMISDLSEQMKDRFDRVDRSLAYILKDLGRAVLLIGEVGRDVDEVRRDLLEAQASLNRLERELHSYLTAGFGRELVLVINGSLGYQARTGFPMAYEDYVDTYGPENEFHTWAVQHAKDRLASPMPDPEDLKDMHVLVGLKSRPLERNVNYIKQFLEKRLGVSSLPDGPVASLADWYAGANAYLRLAAENPQHFRSMPGSQKRLDEVIRAGTELENFFRAITFVKSGSGSKVNRELYEAVLSYYERKLQAFDDAVSEAEAAFGRDASFAVSTWRQWEARRFTVAETAVNGKEGYLRRIPGEVVAVAAGVSHSLAIRANGSVVAWGANYSGHCNVPAGLSDVVAVSAGAAHSLALKKDGTIVAWGNNRYGQCNIPAHEAVKKICAGPNHSLALRADGRVIAWGINSRGACDVPKALTGVIDIAAAGCPQRDYPEISLALKADGTVVCWGKEGKALDGLSNVVAIAAGYGRAIAVKDDGTVIGWKVSDSPTRLDAKAINGVSGVTAVVLGENFTLALKKDGTLEVIAGSIEGTPETGGFVAIAAGRSHALALRDDGTVVAWGNTAQGACGLGDGTELVTGMGRGEASRAYIMEKGRVTSLHGFQSPSGLGPVVEIAEGGGHRLVLKADGTVVEWGGRSKFEKYNVPEGLSDIVAIATGKMQQRGSGHCLALRSDGIVKAWGDNSYGQCDVPPDLKNAVAIAAGWRHSLALREDGQVVIWGDRNKWHGHRNVPVDLDNVVAIASEYNHNLALRADGTVVAWGGENKYGECNVPKGLSGVIAIAAGTDRSLVLKADGTVAAWGRNDIGQCDFAAAQTGVVAMTSRGGYSRDSFLLSLPTPGVENAKPLPFMSAEPPPAVMHRLRALCAHVVDEFDLDLNDSLNQLTGAKVLLESVLALGLPDSLDQDDVLRGYLFGSESLIDREGARALYEAEHKRLHTDEWRRRAPTFKETPKGRLESFRPHLNERLEVLEESGTPEIPRMVGHTLLQLRLLRAAY